MKQQLSTASDYNEACNLLRSRFLLNIKLFFMKTADCMRYSQQFLLFLANNLHQAPFYWRYTFI